MSLFKLKRLKPLCQSSCSNFPGLENIFICVTPEMFLFNREFPVHFHDDEAPVLLTTMPVPLIFI